MFFLSYRQTKIFNLTWIGTSSTGLDWVCARLLINLKIKFSKSNYAFKRFGCKKKVKIRDANQDQSAHTHTRIYTHVCSTHVHTHTQSHTPILSDMLLCRCSFGVPRPSDRDFLRSLLHHFQSGCALKWASFIWKTTIRGFILYISLLITLSWKKKKEQMHNLYMD